MMKNFYNALGVVVLLYGYSLSTTAQNINYFISVTQVTWDGNFDLREGDSEEFGLEGLPGGACISASGDNAASVLSNVIIAAGSDVPPFVFSTSYTGIENNSENDQDFCTSDANDQPICEVPIVIDLDTVPFGLSQALFSCKSGRDRGLFITLTLVKFLPGLPIELADFQAQAIDEQVHLDWTTAVEINNDYMVVERSADGIHFTELGRVQGNGSISNPQDYHFLDENPIQGTGYYRLRQVDLDGTEEYHQVVSVDIQGLVNSEFGLQVFPNPTRDQVQARWQPGLQEPVQFVLYNMTGRQVANYTIASDLGTFEIPLEDLSSGIYILQTQQGDKVDTRRIQKMQ